MTLALRRFRLDGIGPPGARFDPLAVDLTAEERAAATAVLFLENGGGKSVLLRLLFAVVLPGRRQTVGSVKLDGYVGSDDTGHVALEWDTPDGRLVTGTVLEWRNRTRSGSSSNLVQLWYAFVPQPGVLTLDVLPTRDDGRRVTRAGVRERLAALGRAHPELELVVEDGPTRWAEHLVRATPLDPEIFRYQRQMNADEADAESLFAGVRTDEDFVRFVVEASHDPDQLDGFDDLLTTYAGQLARRQELEVEAGFYRDAIAVLRPLGAAATALGEARTAAAAARRGAERLRARLAAGIAHAEGLARTRDTEARTAGERADRLTRDATELGDVAAELRRREAAFRHEAATAAERAATTEARDTADAVAAWAAVGVVVDARRHAHERRTLQAAQEASDRELEPLRRAADEAAARYAGRLLAEATALDGESAAATDDAAAAAKLADEHLARRAGAERQAGEAVADARGKRDRVAEVDRAVAAVRDAGLAGAAEPVAEARRRVERDEEEAAQALAAARERRRTLDAARAEMTPRLTRARGDEAAAEARLRSVRAELDGHHRAAAEIVAHPRTGEIAPDAADAWLVADRLEEVLDAAVRSSEAAERALRAGLEDVDARLDHLGVDGLLPAAPDVVRVWDAVVAAGIGASTGWMWLARNRDDAGRAQALATNPALAGGVIVTDPARLDAATRAVADAGVETGGVVLLGTEAQLAETGAGTAAPVRPALYDPGWTERTRQALDAEREELVTRQEAALAALAVDAPLLDAVRDLRRRCPLTRRDDLDAEAERLDEELLSARSAIATFDERLAELGEQVTALDDGEPALVEAQRTAADAHRRLADLETGVTAARTWAAEAEDAEARSEALRHEAETAGGEAAEERDRAEAARTRSRRATADASRRRDEAGTVSTVPVTPPDDVATGELRGAADAARAAYEAERAGRDLTADIERVEAALSSLEGRLAELVTEVRRRAEDLADAPGADDPALRRTRLAEARDAYDAAEKRLSRCRTELGAASNALTEREKAARRRPRIDPAVEPVDADAAARAAADHDARAQEAAGDARRAREEATERAEQARRAAGRAELLGGTVDLLPVPEPAADGEADPSPGSGPGHGGDSPGGGAGAAAVLAWTGGVDEAKQAARDARRALDEAARAVADAERTVERAGAAVRALGKDPTFTAARIAVQVTLAGEGLDSLAGRAGALAAELEAMGDSVEAELADTLKHREGIVSRLATLVEAQLRQLKLLTRLSTLPAGLGDWSGKPFVSVNFDAVSAGEITARLGPIVDEAATRESRKRTGLGLLLAGMRAAVAQPQGDTERTFTVRLLRPNRTMTFERATVGELEREFSGGMKLTAAICTYCALAALRANSRSTGSLFGVDPGPLFLDNPLGKASADYLLDLQHAIAERLGVQLVHTTGVWDVEALATYERVVRLRNLADLRRNVRRLRVDDEVELPGADGGTGAAVDAVSFAVRRDAAR